MTKTATKILQGTTVIQNILGWVSYKPSFCKFLNCIIQIVSAKNNRWTNVNTNWAFWGHCIYQCITLTSWQSSHQPFMLHAWTKIFYFVLVHFGKSRSVSCPSWFPQLQHFFATGNNSAAIRCWHGATSVVQTHRWERVARFTSQRQLIDLILGVVQIKWQLQ